jgi:hypothetical protein
VDGTNPGLDPVTRTDFVRRVGRQLSDMARKGKVERIGKRRVLRWELAAEDSVA